MNNFVFSQDPLLFRSVIPNSNQYTTESDIKKQLDATMAQYQALQQMQPPQMQQQNQQFDYLGELDKLTKNIDSDVAEKLSVDTDYLRINAELQALIQEEMISNVKWRINNNQNAVKKMTELKDIITMASKEKSDENRKNMMELNDYIKNYSDLTFDEYKQLKNKK